jgi:hypothetical protein
MTGSERRVRAVRVTAPDAALGRRGVLLLEDALRTATLPGAEDGALYLFRRLDVGLVRAEGGPATLALAIERRVQALRARVVHAAGADAAAAPAVYFRDLPEALALLALRLARGDRTDAWFWPLAVPGWPPGAPRDEGLRAILAAASSSPAGPHAVAALAAALHEQGALDPLLAALRPEDGPALLRIHGWTPAAPRPTARHDHAGHALPPEPPRQPAAHRMPTAWAATLTRWVSRWPAGDPRSLWLAATALVARAPALVLDPGLRREALQLLEAMAPPPAHGPRADAPPARPGSAPPAEPHLTPEIPLRPVAAPDAAASASPGAGAAGRPPALPPLAPGVGSEPGERQPAAPFRAGDRRAGDSSERTPSAPIPAAPLPPPGEANAGVPARAATGVPEREREPPAECGEAPARSEAAGLAFLLPVLERVGIERVLLDSPHLARAELPGRVLALAARRLRLPADDPCRLLFPGREPLAAGEAADADAAARALLLAAVRWLRRAVRIGLRGLVCRPGGLSVTRTHLDVYFDLRQVDIRIRRTGLDLDPGWLPWLGRVVAFHYGDGGARR